MSDSKQAIADAISLMEDHDRKLLALALSLTNQLAPRANGDCDDPVAHSLAEVLEERIVMGPIHTIRRLLESVVKGIEPAPAAQ